MLVRKPVLIISGDDTLRHQLEVALPEGFYALSAETFYKATAMVCELNADTRLSAVVFSLDMRCIVVALETMATLRACGATTPMVAIVSDEKIMPAARNAGAREVFLRETAAQKLAELLAAMQPPNPLPPLSSAIINMEAENMDR